ncbi:hypothetical protein L596_017548 [Steinernema carpocapsae]|uniref:Uncharacterized protein n=1 Tax=Steinernema carpocapsae TaxID=34508 RepID=A0A4U5N201_STECR|nr:hypothetical protein L596_017548 [Steinernema carpocapsae]
MKFFFAILLIALILGSFAYADRAEHEEFGDELAPSVRAKRWFHRGWGPGFGYGPRFGGGFGPGFGGGFGGGGWGR